MSRYTSSGGREHLEPLGLSPGAMKWRLREADGRGEAAPFSNYGSGDPAEAMRDVNACEYVSTPWRGATAVVAP